MMKKVILLALFQAVYFSYVQGQIDSINTINHKLQLEQLSETTNAYLVYFQDSVDAPKRNMEIWERTLVKELEKGRYNFTWNRYFAKGSYINYTIQAGINDFKPIREEMSMHRLRNDSVFVTNKCFVYGDNSIRTSPDKAKHSGKPFQLDDLNHSFNWEMDMETFSMLPFGEGKKFAINFYHPGSKTLPAYYLYVVDRSEEIEYNSEPYDCWVLRIDYTSGDGHTEFWIDKKTKRMLKMREVFRGILRYKILLPA